MSEILVSLRLNSDQTMDLPHKDRFALVSKWAVPETQMVALMDIMAGLLAG